MAIKMNESTIYIRITAIKKNYIFIYANLNFKWINDNQSPLAKYIVNDFRKES